jgi:ABC-type transport system involved in cytochrome c biogenesis permease subunit
MKNKSKTRSTKKKIDFTPQGIDAPLMRGDLLLIPLGILTALSIFVTAPQLISAPGSASLSTILALLTLVGFGILYVYETLRRHKRSLTTRIMAAIPAVSLLIAFILTLLSSSGGNSCTGFFGTPTDCISMQHVVLYFLLFNPLTTSFLGITSLVGIFSILLKSRK